MKYFERLPWIYHLINLIALTIVVVALWWDQLPSLQTLARDTFLFFLGSASESILFVETHIRAHLRANSRSFQTFHSLPGKFLLDRKSLTVDHQRHLLYCSDSKYSHTVVLLLVTPSLLVAISCFDCRIKSCWRGSRKLANLNLVQVDRYQHENHWSHSLLTKLSIVTLHRIETSL